MTPKFGKNLCRQVTRRGSIMTANLKGQGHYDHWLPPGDVTPFVRQYGESERSPSGGRHCIMTVKFGKYFGRLVKRGGDIMTANLKGQGRYDCNNLADRLKGRGRYGCKIWQKILADGLKEEGIL